ncbi:MAG: ATP-binding protein, partial [Acidimicrobiia bacterium]
GGADPTLVMGPTAADHTEPSALPWGSLATLETPEGTDTAQTAAAGADTAETTAPLPAARDGEPAAPGDTASAAPRGSRPGRSRLRHARVAVSSRVRILGWATLLLVVAGAATLLVQRRVLLDQLDDRVDDSLDQEVSELRQLAVGQDPATGEPFTGDVGAIFRTFIERNVPDEGETLIALARGEPPIATLAPYPLWEDAALMDRWRSLTASERATEATPAGPVRYQAVPLTDGGEVRGVFVVATFVQAERDEIDQQTRVSAAVYGVVLLAAVGLAWLMAGRVFAPVRVITDTARELSESDLSRRIPVPDSDDEIAELAGTFNGMLDRLDAAFTTQRRFLDDAGHELRTPITIIRGHLELEGDHPGDRRATRAVVLDELDRMGRIVDDLLVLARAGQPDFLRPEPVDLDLLTSELFAKARALADRDWRLDATGHGVVHADPQRLTQAVMNLVDNAVRHTGEGAVIALGSALEPRRACLWVRDTGPGIPPEQQERIFERFARARDGGRRPGTSGLGLAIVRSIARAHQGWVTLDSRPGAGATFTICVPSDDPIGGEAADQPGPGSARR